MHPNWFPREAHTHVCFQSRATGRCYLNLTPKQSLALKRRLAANSSSPMPKPLQYCWKKAIVDHVAAAEAAAAQQRAASSSASTAVNCSSVEGVTPSRGNVIISPSQLSHPTNTHHDDHKSRSDPASSSTSASPSELAPAAPEYSNEIRSNVYNDISPSNGSLHNDNESAPENRPDKTKNHDLIVNDSIVHGAEAPSGSSEVLVCAKKSSPYFECSHCSKRFRHKSYYDYHLRTHTGDRPFKCHLCPKTFLERSKLNRHLGSCHNLKINRIYEVADDGSVHEQQNKCPQCQKCFSRAENLQTHIQMVHEKLRPYSCSQCEKTFSGMTALKSHEKSHAGVKNIACTVCGKTFLLKKYLDLHMSTTHKKDPKKHACQYCRKEFFWEKDLKRHLLIHSKEKNFKCSLCETSFKRKDNLNRHLRLSHSLVPANPNPEQVQPQVTNATGATPEAGQPLTESPTKSNESDESIMVLCEVPAPVPVVPAPAPVVNQVSVIKSTLEARMSISRGEPFI